MNLEIGFTQISEEDIWYFLFNEHPNSSKSYRSPFRSDTNPGCKFYWTGSRWLFRDFAESKSFNYYTALCEYFSCPFGEALERMVKTPGLIKNIQKLTPKKKERSIINPKPFLFQGKPSWSEKGKLYWKALGVSREQLEREKTKTMDVWKFDLNDDTIIPNYPCFCYCFTEGVYKIYQPLGKIKWLSNGNSESHWYLKRGSNVLWLTKSNKDLLVLENFVPYDLMCFFNEGSYPFMLEEICKDYDKVFINMDNDRAGINFTNKLLSLIPNGEAFYFPGREMKDASDILLGWGEEILKSYL